LARPEPKHPLAGRTVVVTRAEEQAGALIEALERLGARVLALPSIELVDPPDWGPCDAALDAIRTYDWIVFTSVNAYRRLEARAEARPGARRFRLREVVDEVCRPYVAAIGPTTARVLRAAGVHVAAVPADVEARAEGLLAVLDRESSALLPRRSLAGAHVLLPRALEARDVLPEGLSRAGAIVHVVPVYRVVAGGGDPAPVREALREGKVDAVVVLSGRTGLAFVERLAVPDAERSLLLSAVRPITGGPVTTEAIAGLGFGPPIEAREPTTAGVLAAIVTAFEEDAR
jgi:uroporphyrinogen III methyltransferase / synthase